MKCALQSAYHFYSVAVTAMLLFRLFFTCSPCARHFCLFVWCCLAKIVVVRTMVLASVPQFHFDDGVGAFEWHTFDCGSEMCGPEYASMDINRIKSSRS